MHAASRLLLAASAAMIPLVCQQQSSPLTLGSAISDFEGRTSDGKRRHVSGVLKKGVSVLVPVPASVACRNALEIAKEFTSAMKSLQISAVFLLDTEAVPRCEAAAESYLLTSVGPWSSTAGERILALLIDQDRRLRRVFRASGREWMLQAVVEDAKLWRDGEAIFKSQCARCHGEDGRDETYPGTKSLSGIGNRHSTERILDLTQMAGFVDLTALNETARRALVLFVAGL